ncbi:unnamed protein product, partial [Aureobasidium pullulans]
QSCRRAKCKRLWRCPASSSRMALSSSTAAPRQARIPQDQPGRRCRFPRHGRYRLRRQVDSHPRQQHSRRWRI